MAKWARLGSNQRPLACVKEDKQVDKSRKKRGSEQDPGDGG
jgi:hypothetical protein